jgi:hypothetical protein
MLRSTLVAALLLASPAIAVAQGTQQPINLLPTVPPGDKPLLDEPNPNFQAVRPAGEAESAQPQPSAQGQVQPAPGQIPPIALPTPTPLPPQAIRAPDEVQPARRAPEPQAIPVPAAEPPTVVAVPTGTMPLWTLGVLVLCGAFLAGLFGILTALLMRRAETRQRRRAVAATLAAELETRRLAFEAVPLPPNIEAGVSFVSSVTSLAGIDAGFRSAQGNLHLLPPKLAAHVSVHYAAVQRVSDFVKGQSLAAAVRMLQANRLGGYPCPDAGAMRDAHEELGAAFRGCDKLVQMLRALV